MDGVRSRPLWPSLIVLVGTVAVVAVVLLAVADRGPDPLADGVGEVVTEPTPTNPTPPSIEPTPEATGSATSPLATPDSGPEASDSPTATVPAVTVDVLNETLVTGLAGRAADVLAATGWQVGLIDNSALGAPSTTVYVPTGLEAEAEALSDAFPALTRTRPTFEGLDPGRLTIVLAEPDAELVVSAMEATTLASTGGTASASRFAPAGGAPASR